MHIFTDKIVKTKKKHRCFACQRIFEKGTRMRNQVNTSDGIVSVYTCETCMELMDRYSDNFFDDYEHMFPAGCVDEFLNKNETPEELLIRLKN